jgi:hypothetical protein
MLDEPNRADHGMFETTFHNFGMLTRPADRQTDSKPDDAYVAAAGPAGQKYVPLFRTLGGRGCKQLTADRMTRQDFRGA